MSKSTDRSQLITHPLKTIGAQAFRGALHILNQTRRVALRFAHRRPVPRRARANEEFTRCASNVAPWRACAWVASDLARSAQR